MTITGETKAELRRLHAAFRDADIRLAEDPGSREWSDNLNDAERVLSHQWIGCGPSVLDALAAAEAERDRLLEQTETMRSALIQARGALRLDAMVDRDGNPYGTTGVALEAIDAALGDTPCP